MQNFTAFTKEEKGLINVLKTQVSAIYTDSYLENVPC